MSMQSRESAGREQWICDTAAEVLRILVPPTKSGWTEIAHEAVTDVLSRHYPKEKQMLPKFGSTTQCPKCGSEQIFSKYVAPPQANQEVMQRMCGGCGYGWNEAPLDRVAAQGEQHDH